MWPEVREWYMLTAVSSGGSRGEAPPAGPATSQAGRHPLELLGDLNVHASEERLVHSRLSPSPFGHVVSQLSGR